jgi:hypothetical protein
MNATGLFAFLLACHRLQSTEDSESDHHAHEGLVYRSLGDLIQKTDGRGCGRHSDCPSCRNGHLCTMDFGSQLAFVAEGVELHSGLAVGWDSTARLAEDSCFVEKVKHIHPFVA